MPLQLVAHFVPEDKSGSVWRFTEVNRLLKVNKDTKAVEASIEVGDATAVVHLSVLQQFWNRVPQIAYESVDESVIRGLKCFTPEEDIVLVLNALNFASDMNTLFWCYCAWLYKDLDGLDEDVKTLMVDEQPWKIVKAFPCQIVIARAVRCGMDGYNLYDHIYKCEWDETDKELWLIYVAESFMEYTNSESESELSDIVCSLPVDLQECEEVVKLMLQFQTLPLLKNLIRYEGPTADAVVDLCVDFLCSSRSQSKYINTFNLVILYINKSETWWRLMCGYNSPLVSEENLGKSVFAKYVSVPDNIIETLCECADCTTRTVRLALMVHAGTDFSLSTAFELHHNEQAIKQNIVVLIAKLCYSSQIQLVKMLIKERYFSLLKIPFKLMSGSFPFLQLAAAKLSASDMLVLHPLFKYDVDGSCNVKLSSLFYGDLCRHSKDSTCSQMYAHLVLRVRFKNDIQIVQDDQFTLPYASDLCAMCSNIYEAGMNYDKQAIQTFLQNPRYARLRLSVCVCVGFDVAVLQWRC